MKSWAWITMAAAFFGGMNESLNCFVEGTLVFTAVGLVAIEKIKAGDLVMAADENGNRGLKRVVRTFARQTDSIVTVNAGEMAIRCTPEHPFFKTGRYNWTLWASKRKQFFVTEAGADPNGLSLPPSTNPNVYQEYEVIKEIPNTICSEIAAWGDSPGGGLQFELPDTIMNPIKNGFIVPK